MVVEALLRHARLVVASAFAFIAASAMLDAANKVVASASGSGQTIVDGELRTFSFVVLQDVSGNTAGMAEVNNRSVDEMFQLDLDCLNVFDDMAIISGIFTRHTDAHAIGLTGVFAVVDGGEGENSTDLITQVFFFPPGVVTCTDFIPDDAAPFLEPITAGNVQVH